MPATPIRNVDLVLTSYHSYAHTLLRTLYIMHSSRPARSFMDPTQLTRVDEMPENSNDRPVWQEYGRRMRTKDDAFSHNDWTFAFWLNAVGIDNLETQHRPWLLQERERLKREIGTLSEQEAISEQDKGDLRFLSNVEARYVSSYWSLREKANASAYKCGVDMWLAPESITTVVNSLKDLTVDTEWKGAKDLIASFPSRVWTSLMHSISKQAGPTYFQSGSALLSHMDRIARFGPLRGLSGDDFDEPWRKCFYSLETRKDLTRRFRDHPFDARCMFPPKNALIPDRRGNQVSTRMTINGLHKALLECEQAYTSADIESQKPRWVLTGPDGSSGPLICIRRLNVKEVEEADSAESTLRTLDRLH